MVVKEGTWQPLPVPDLHSPLFALACQRDGCWAGGLGGVAWYPASEEASQRRVHHAQPPLAPVTALLALDELLLVGGSEGIASSRDNGATWQQVELEDRIASITAFAVSPTFAEDQTIVAATMASGILRTNDAGRTWTNVSFGLESLEVTALVWEAGAHVLAATTDGIYRSRDAGRAWRRIYEADDLNDDLDIETLLCQSDGSILAVQANGALLRSNDRGKSWSSNRGLNDQLLTSCLTETGALLAGCLSSGLSRSVDGGVSWQRVWNQAVHVLACAQGRIFAGTDNGMIMSVDDGLSWRSLAGPPLHDLSRLLICEQQLLLVGAYSGIWRLTSNGDWGGLPDLPQPLLTVVPSPDGQLLFSGAEGLFCVSLAEQTLRALIEGADGQAMQLTARRIGTACHIWVASVDGQHLLHSADAGATWRTIDLPFGILPLVTLHALPDRLLAATYDPRQYRVCLWYSLDNGVNWTQSAEATTNWPLVATCPDLALLTIGNLLFLEDSAGAWQQHSVGDDGGAVRRVVGVNQAGQRHLFVLTTTGIQHSSDMGTTWQKDDGGLSGKQMLDLTADETWLYVLCAGGQVWKRAI